MSNFEKEFNSGKMKGARWVILFAVLILIGFLGYYFQNVTIALVAGIIAVGLFFGISRSIKG